MPDAAAGSGARRAAVLSTHTRTATRVDLSGLVAVVTGGGRNIGLAIARALAGGGAAVVIVDWDPDVPEQAAAELRAGGAEALGVVGDVGDAASMARVAAAVRARFGRVDIVINNAGVNVGGDDARQPIDRFRQADWDRILRVDLTGPYTVTQALMPLLEEGLPKRGGGAAPPLEQRMEAAAAAPVKRIVNIASVAGVVPLRLQSAFVAAKAGVINLTRSMALELGPRGITSNVVCPGSVLTEGTRALFYGDKGAQGSAYAGQGSGDNRAARMLSHVPLNRPASCAEIAHAVLMLVAPEASYFNGATIVVDGGWTCGFARDF